MTSVSREDSVALLFDACLAVPRERRQEVLIGEDLELLEEVECLLAQHDRCGSFLEPSQGGLGRDDQPPMLTPGTIVAEKYEILGPPMRGGMGEVYLAHRIRDYSKRLALKVVRSGRHSQRMHDAFERE